MISRLDCIRIGGEEPTDMTAFTAIGQALMNRTKQRCRCKRSRGIVTDTAFALCRDVVGCLALRDTRVVTGCTVIGIDTQVVKGDAGKAAKVAGRVTRRAIQSRRYMIQRLSNTDIAVMALRAITGIDTHVTKRHNSKAGGVMAIDTILVIGVRRYVIRQLADADHIVVARSTVICYASMIIGTRAKSTRRVTNLAILAVDRQMLVERRTQGYTGRVNTIVTVIAPLRQDSRVSVVYTKRGDKALGAVARATIGCGCRVDRYRGRFGRRVNTGAIVVARFTRLHHGIDQAVVENATGQLERDDAMAGIAIEYGIRQRMTDRLTQCRTRAISNMTGITVHTCNRRPGVVGIGILETDRGMAVTAF